MRNTVNDERGLPNRYLGAVWLTALLFSGVLVAWQLLGGLNCLSVDFLATNMAFEGILLAAVALSVQKSENSILMRAGANHKTTVFLMLLIFASAGASGFAFLHPSSGSTICFSLFPPSGLFAFSSFFLFVLTLSFWGSLLLYSMVREFKVRKQRNC
jgi:hypothetical protein